MGRDWRLVDSGLRSAAQNVALDRALLEARRAEEIPSTLRFYRTTPSVMLGIDQSAAHDVHADFCGANGISIQRRLTVGPTYYTDPRQLGWSLYAQTRDLGGADLRRASRHVCHAVASAVAALDVDARVRRHDEIEIDGRTIGACSVATDGKAVVFHGYLLLAVDIETLVQALRMPATYALEHLSSAAGERLADLARALERPPDVRQVRHNIVEAMESAFEVELGESDTTLTEEVRYCAALPEIDTPGWNNMTARAASDAPAIEATARSGATSLRVAFIVDRPMQRLKRIWIATDPSTNPRRTLADLEAELRDAPLASIARKIEWFFSSRPPVDTLRPNDIIDLITRALGEPLVSTK